MGKLLTTDLKVVRFSSMRGNVCDKDSGTICCRSSTIIVFTCYQGKVQEGQFDDFPTGYRDIPGTNPVCVIVVGKIGAGNVTTSSSNGFPRRIGRTVGKQLLQFILTVRNIFLNVHLSLISSDSP